MKTPTMTEVFRIVEGPVQKWAVWDMAKDDEGTYPVILAQTAAGAIANYEKIPEEQAAVEPDREFKIPGAMRGIGKLAEVVVIPVNTTQQVKALAMFIYAGARDQADFMGSFDPEDRAGSADVEDEIERNWPPELGQFPLKIEKQSS